MYKPQVKKEKKSIKIQTLQNLIEGEVYLLPNNRISDMLNQESFHFIPLTDAKIFSLKAKSLIEEVAFMAVNKYHVVYIHEIG